MKHSYRAAFAAALIGCCAAMAASAQDYPSKPIRIIVPLPPGGSNDVLARVLGEEMSKTLGQPFVVENKPGAAGNIGTDQVAKARPDGYTLGIAPNQTVAVNPALYPKLPFDVQKDLMGIGLMATLPMTLVVPSSSKAGSIDELVAMAKAEPGKLTYASAGSGSPQHMSAEIFQSLTSTQMTHVPYKGSNPALVDVLAGTVDVMFCPINSALPYIQNGRLKALGVTGAQRLQTLPEVPTIAEKVPNFASDIWIGLIAPAGTPPEIVQKLNTELNRALKMPAVQAKLAEQGIQAATSTPAELDRMMRDDRKRWAEVIKRANIRVD
ncbi:tripartite tricarboxylate transporter substrate binding protein [Pigmentiphaga sp. H8]|uniref:Bug family tripartite tricarboxylate transporter substrate binding protein n=1 Tax=Pigmentiphaga sp. H8 TaxID=2488560 RepID=UPI001EDEF1D8|nr:tripartite tricarboxylate transporter substrate binding protein [Pigmentiphaga sp. H8]